jgi:glutamate-5-semialdehyde dehydrogenase
MSAIAMLGQQAKQASLKLISLTSEQKNQALCIIADEIEKQTENIQKANAIDLANAKKIKLSDALIDRLSLNKIRLQALAEGVRKIAALPDPIGKVLSEQTRPNGIHIRKVRVPIGVIAVIYESRPNVTADVVSLCLKTSNAVLLRGGSEALHSNIVLVSAIKTALTKTAIPTNAIQFVASTDRNAIKELVQLKKYVDLVIPRGGENLINVVTELAQVPVIKNHKGVCHIYVDAGADLAMAAKICENAKCQRPGVCNAMETLLVNEKVARTFLPLVTQQMAKYAVEFRGDDAAKAIIPSMKSATTADWETEYLDYILAVKIVKNVQDVIEHINTYGTHHSDAIISNDDVSIQKFLHEVDSAAVYVNASTRFTDGGEFGMGAEIGISTDKLHARGPMGLEELTTYKYLITGSGQIRD